MQKVTPTSRWRVVPTLLVVVSALALGAASARADDGGSARHETPKLVHHVAVALPA